MVGGNITLINNIVDDFLYNNLTVKKEYELNVGNSKNAHLIVGDIHTSKSLLIGYDTKNDYAFLQAVDPDQTWNKPLYLQKLSGNVSIGNIAPNEKLNVNGNVRANRFISSTKIYPDFVFDQDYKKLSLNDLETFINKYQHLPDIPTEDFVKENGVDLTDLNIKLLEKIEIMTLYILDLNEKNKELEIRLQKLEPKSIITRYNK